MSDILFLYMSSGRCFERMQKGCQIYWGHMNNFNL